MDFFRATIQFVILLTPFFVLSVFIGLTEHMTEKAKKRLAIRSSLAILCLCILIYFLGDLAFRLLGITLNSFRIGAGLVLLLSGLDMVRSSPTSARNGADTESPDNDPAVVPLATPTAIGPGVIGALIVMKINAQGQFTMLLYDIGGIILAVAMIAVMLCFSSTLLKIFPRRAVVVLSKLTGLFLTALAAQIIYSGIAGFFPNLVQ